MPDFLKEIAPFKAAVPLVLLALFWAWETWRPFFRVEKSVRYRHALRNLLLAVSNTLILSLAFGALTVFVAIWAEKNAVGLLYQFSLPTTVEFVLAILALDCWFYIWHRANHRIPFLWRFHRVHHSDPDMDVTTATRFHIGEHIGASILRLGIICLVGLNVWHVVAYEIAVVAMTQFHHANISLGKWDRIVRVLIVTPDMHKVHHSRKYPETDSNYSTIFSFWDRIAFSFRMRKDPSSIQFGLKEYDHDRFQTLLGMLKIPFGPAKKASKEPVAEPGGGKAD